MANMTDREEMVLLHAVLSIVKLHRIDNKLFPTLDPRHFVMDEESAKCIAEQVVEHLIINGYRPVPPTN
jgi:vesicle coat complex subunit